MQICVSTHARVVICMYLSVRVLRVRVSGQNSIRVYVWEFICMLYVNTHVSVVFAHVACAWCVCVCV